MIDPEMLISLDGKFFETRKIFDPKWLEPFEMRLLAELAPRFEIFVDIGANVGIYTNAIAKLNGGNIVIHSFEPDKLNFLCLQNATYINNLQTRIHLNNVAVSDHTGSVDFYISTTNRGDHRTSPAGEIREKVTVPCMALDDYFRSIPITNMLVKFDIQGAEHAAVKGFRETLRRVNGDLAIVMEFWPEGLHSAGVTTDEMIELIRDIGGDIFMIDEASSHLFRVDVGWIKKYCSETLTVASGWHTNFLITRPSRVLADTTTKYLT